MIGIGRHTDYAARVVLHLACLEEGARVTVAEIASRRLLPRPFIRRIVGRLAAAGILRTTRGAGGGVSLARRASGVSLLDVVRAMEGGVALNACVDAPDACPLARACPVQRAWVGATRSLEKELAAVRFDGLADSGKHRSAHARSARGRGAGRARPASRARRKE